MNLDPLGGRSATVQVMTKTPELGKVKTRLAKTWGNDLALEAYLVLVNKTIKTVEQSGLPRQLHITGSMQHPLWQQATNNNWQIQPQNGHDLGERMLSASQHQRSILIGCDFPGLTASLLQQVNNKLDEYDVVVIPATDGGYVLLAANQAHTSLFNGHNWGSDTVWKTTKSAIDALNVRYFCYPPAHDLDTAHDWELAAKNGLLPSKHLLKTIG